MKIIEGLKRMKVLEKRIKDLCPRITEYAAVSDIMKPHFGSDEAQSKEVTALLRSGEDLHTEYLKLKRDLDYTNVMTKVEIGGKQFSLVELLTIRRKTAALMLEMYKSLTDARVRLERSVRADGPAPKVMKYYDEKMKNEKLAYWQDLLDNIDSRLEVINANMDMQTAP